MKTLKLLDLFCGAGGVAVGYHRAGFLDITGVDNRPQKNYPFNFVQADALQYASEHSTKFDVIHASPPCQHYSITKSIHARTDLPDLVPSTRQLLDTTGRVYVIENVPGSPLGFSALVCGLALGLRVKRHRYFEANVFLFGTVCPLGHRDAYISVAGHSVLNAGKSSVSVQGGGAPAKADNRRRADVATARQAMGIDWMTRDELSQAIPPAYTAFIGRQLRQLFT